MVLRIHFTSEDLSRVVLASRPDPMWEVLLSMHLLQNQDGPLVFGRWRKQVAGRAGQVWGGVRLLAPPRGYSPDFLTPALPEPGGELDDGIEALLSTPRHRLRTDLTELAQERRIPAWGKRLADGDIPSLRALADVLRRHHRLAVAPFWSHIRARFDANRAAVGAAMLNQGLAGTLPLLHSSLRWESPILYVDGGHLGDDLHLRGRGLRLVPSFFCWPGPTLLKDPELAPVLVYPVDHDPLWLAGNPAAPPAAPEIALGALLGKTRATVLRAAADSCTTTDLARRSGISPASASHHAGILREARLLNTRRVGGAVIHHITPLGAALLHGNG